MFAYRDKRLSSLCVSCAASNGTECSMEYLLQFLILPMIYWLYKSKFDVRPQYEAELRKRYVISILLVISTCHFPPVYSNQLHTRL
jgi:hypothetical protein